MVKRFFQLHGEAKKHVNRYSDEVHEATAPFDILTRKAVGPDAEELKLNPRARSAKLRVGRRTTVPAMDLAASDISTPDHTRRT